MKGLFISFEGPDGSGKTTQAALLREYCEKKNYNIICTREPGGTAISEAIRQIILDPSHPEMGARTEALLYAASRAQHTDQLIKPAVADGKIVICDRFMDSSIAYQAYGRGLGDGVRMINEFAVDGIQPDMTIYIDVDPMKALERVKKGRSLDRLEQESIDFHMKVCEGYKKLCELYKDRYIIINGDRSIEEVHADVVKAFEDYVFSGNQ